MFQFMLLLSLLLNSSIFSEGFIAGTLVKTKDTYIPIDQLQENDSVISYSFKEKVLRESKILKVKKEHYNEAIRLTVNGTEIITSPEHRFFCPLRKGNWKQAKDLQVNDFILKNISDLVRIEKIDKINCEIDCYCLSILNNHNFFISEKDILVHNFLVLPVFYGLGTWLAATFKVKLTVTLGGLAIAIIGNSTRSKNLTTMGTTVTLSAVSAGILEMAGTKEEKLPKSGQIPFKPKKHKGKDLIRNEQGDYIDNKDRGWRWDPIKSEWDVQVDNGKTHINVGTDGNITHPKPK